MLGARCIFCTSSVKQHSPDTETLWFSLQLGVIAVRVGEERVLKLEPPRSLYLPLTRLSCDWIITPVPPGNCRSWNPLMFWRGEKRRKRKCEPDNNSVWVGAAVALVISYIIKLWGEQLRARTEPLDVGWHRVVCACSSCRCVWHENVTTGAWSQADICAQPLWQL